MIKFVMLPVIGFIIGIFTIMFGAGGGLLYTSILCVCFGVPGPIAASCSLATRWPTLMLGSYSHWKNGHVRIDHGIAMAITGALGCIVGSLWSLKIPLKTYDALLAFIMLTSAIFITIKPDKLKGISLRLPMRWISLILGCLGGVLAGVFGMSGSGPLIAGLALLGLSAVEIIGTSSFVLAAISLAGFITHWRTGATDWTSTALLLGGTLIGAWIAPRLLDKINTDRIEQKGRPIIAICLAVTGVFLLRNVLF